MKMRVSILLALRFLGIGVGKSVSNARKSLLGAIAGIGISLVPLVIVLVVADGMIEGISSRIIELSTSHLRVADYTGTSGMTDDPVKMENLAARIVSEDTTSLIVGANAECQGIGIVIGKNGRSGATLRSVQDVYFSPNSRVRAYLEASEGTLAFTGENDAFLGKKLASDIGVSVGDTFRVLTMKTGVTGASIPRFTTFTVKAIVSSGYQELDALWVFIPFKTGFRILSGDSSSSFINVSTTNSFGNLEILRYALMRTLPEGFSVYTWKELNRSQFQLFTTTRTLLLFIMMLIVFIASVNVSSALIMLVMERRKEIAILKSTGASPSGIAFAFLFAGFLTGLGGVLAGLPVGILCAIHINGLFRAMEKILNAINGFVYIVFSASSAPPVIHLLDPAYYLEVIPVHLRFNELFLIVSGTIILSVMVSIVPAIRAGKEKPLDTLRKF